MILPATLSLALLSPVPGAAQDGTLDRAALEDFRYTLEGLAATRGIPGLSAAIVHRREIVWSAGIGHADLEEDVFAEPDTRYRIASVSKTLAAVLLMQEVEKGTLSLDTPMRDFAIPVWFAPDPVRYREREVLVRHVLSHTSEGEPGARYSYNGNVFGDLTHVLEEVTGEAYPRLLARRIFEPAGMERSVPGHVVPGTDTPIELARPYRRDGDFHELATFQMLDPMPGLDLTGFDPVYAMPEEGVALRRKRLGDAFLHFNGVSAASGVVSTVLDLARFDIALDAGKLVSAESVDLMFTPTVANDGTTLPYGLGWFVEEIDGKKVVWHYGWLPPTVSALYLKVPAEELSLVLLANNDRLSAQTAWTALGVRASPFAAAFLDAFVPEGK
jgi:CubicO group peptidase (beta-lactamase class C family)